MSGGSYDYFYSDLEDFANSIDQYGMNPKRAAFRRLLLLCAKAAHDIEWVDSGDLGDGDESEAIDKVFGFLSEKPDKIQKAAAYDDLKEMIEKYFGKL